MYGTKLRLLIAEAFLEFVGSMFLMNRLKMSVKQFPHRDTNLQSAVRHYSLSLNSIQGDSEKMGNPLEYHSANKNKTIEVVVPLSHESAGTNPVTVTNILITCNSDRNISDK